MNLQKWQSHKVVEAGRIMSASPKDGEAHASVIVMLADGSCEQVKLGREVTARYWPVEGDYLVRYEDGYLSISPRAAFEAGYSRLS